MIKMGCSGFFCAGVVAVVSSNIGLKHCVCTRGICFNALKDVLVGQFK